MPVNSKNTAPDSASTAVAITTFGSSTKFINVQNTDNNVNLRVGFAEDDLLASGMQVLPHETYPIPLDAADGQIFVVSEGIELVNKVILVKG